MAASLLTFYRKEAVDGAIAFFNTYQAQRKPAGSLPFFNVLDKNSHLRYEDSTLIPPDFDDLSCLSNVSANRN
jgi:hypothetical protein